MCLEKLLLSSVDQLRVAQTERKHEWGSLSNAIDEIELSPREKLLAPIDGTLASQQHLNLKIPKNGSIRGYLQKMKRFSDMVSICEKVMARDGQYL